MGCPTMKQSEVDYSDVQGLVRFGYKLMKEASYVLLRVKDVGAARSWLHTAPVTSAIAVSPPPSTALQVALTAAAPKALAVPDPVLAGFPCASLAGSAEGSRVRGPRLVAR